MGMVGKYLPAEEQRKTGDDMNPRVMIRRWAILSVMASAHAASAHGADIPGVVVGKAVDPVSGRGIPGAVAELALGIETRRAVADSTGRFVLAGIPAGKGFTVAALCAGHRSTAVRLSIGSGDTVRVTLSMPSVYLDFLEPKEPRKFIAGTAVAIRWDAGGIAAVRIEFSAAGGAGWMTVAGGIDAGIKEFVWNVPDIPTENGVLRIVAPGKPGMETRTVPFSVTSI